GLGNLVAAINGDQAALGLTASLNVSNGTVALTQNTAGADVVVAGTGLTDNYATQFTTPASGSNSLGTQYMGGILSLNDGGSINALNGNLTGTFTLQNNDAAGTGAEKGNITDTFVMGGGTENLAADGGTITVQGNSLNSLIQAINDETANTGANLDIYASEDSASGGLFLQSGSLTTTAVTVQSTGAGHTLTDNVTEAVQGGSGGSANVDASTLFGNAGTSQITDPVKGTITLTNSGMGAATTFTMDGTTGHTTLGDLKTLINNAGIGLSATIGATGLNVAVSGANYGNTLTVGGSLTDAYGVSLSASSTGNPAVSAQNASATVNTTAGNIVGTGDAITGSLTVQNGATTVTFTMGTANGDIGGTNIAALAQAISDSTTLGVTADVNATTHALEIQANNPGTTLNVTSNLKDTVGENITAPNFGQLHAESTTTMALGSGVIHAADVLTGSVILSGNTHTLTFNMNSTATPANSNIINIAGNTLNDLENAINAQTSTLNITASNVEGGTGLILTSNEYNGTTIGVGTNSLHDTLSASGNTESSASLGSFASAGDVVAGTIDFTVGGQPPVSFAISSGETVSQLKDYINAGNYGVSAAITSTGNNTLGTSTSDNFVNLTLTSNSYGTAGEIGSTGNTQVYDEAATSNLSYAKTNSYNVGLSNLSVYDSSSGQTSLAMASFGANSGGTNGIATISYSDGAGVSLSASDLSNQTDAEASLTTLNTAITDVAAQDGYVGAQINTLNAVSQVLSTQQENVESAQNAVQATDYASATSNMSKYEILSQTGIAALAQANSIQQEVTKLLQ
ncbi:MAG: flagellin, partial [Terracidiphilus sp.]